MDYTTNLGLRQPATTDTYDIGDHNYNSDVLDVEVAAKGEFLTGTATFPSSSTTHVVSNAFLKAATFVLIFPTTADPSGDWSVATADGSFTITSTVTEPSPVQYEWLALNQGVV